MADNIRVQLPAFSMWSKTPIYHGVEAEIDNVRQKTAVFGLLRDVIVPDPTDILYVVPPRGEHRLNLIAEKFYGVEDLWWVIARVNQMLDPLIGPKNGDIIRIPTRDRLSTLGVLNV